MDDQLRPVRQLSRGFAVSAVYAANLHSVHFQNGILCQIDVADRVNAANTRTGAGADMFPDRAHGRPFSTKNRWIPLWRASSSPSEWTPQPATMVTWRPLHIKIVVYQIVDIAVVTQAGM